MRRETERRETLRLRRPRGERVITGEKESEKKMKVDEYEAREGMHA